MKTATNMAQEQKGELMGNLKNMATNAIQEGKLPTDIINSATGGKLNSETVQNGIAQIESTAPAAPQAPLQTSSAATSSQSITSNGSEDVVGKLQHSIFSEEELNILKLMQINHLNPNVREDVVNEKILNVMKTALNNQLSTESAKLTLQKLVLQELPKIAEKIASFNNETLAEIIFRKTMSSADFQRHLKETLEEAAGQNTVVTAPELVNILSKRLLNIQAASSPSPVVPIQTGKGIGTIYPFQSSSNNKTRVRPKRTVKII